MDITALCQKAKITSRELALVPEKVKNQVLSDLSKWLLANQDAIVAANRQDISDGEVAGLSAALIDRLTLTPERIKGMAADLINVVNLPDPVGEIFEETTLSNGLSLRKQRIPLGVLAVIYESRPNVTVDVAALALKSGNAVILRGGSETIRTNRVLVSGIHAVLKKNDLSPEMVQFIDDPDRELVNQLLRMHQYVDMLIPRGGAACTASAARIPVFRSSPAGLVSATCSWMRAQTFRNPCL